MMNPKTIAIASLQIVNDQKYPIDPKIVENGIEESGANTFNQIVFAFVRVFKHEAQRAKKDPVEHRDKDEHCYDNNICEYPNSSREK